MVTVASIILSAHFGVDVSGWVYGLTILQDMALIDGFSKGLLVRGK